MRPASTKLPSSVASISRAVAGDTAFASTKMPPKPATERATSSAACGGQTDRITSLRRTSSSVVRASTRPARSARAAVSALRPSDAHSTVWPAPRSVVPTAAPISPGWRSPIATCFIGLEEELLPRRPPLVRSRDDRARVDRLDARAVAQLRDRAGPFELHLDLARLAGVVGRDGLEVRQRLLRARLDELTGPLRLQHSRAEDEDSLLHCDGREPLAEKRLALAARRGVAGDHQDGAAPGAAERRVDARLADQRVIEPEVLVVPSGNGVVHDAVRRTGHRMHADEEGPVDPGLQEARVLRPVLLDDEL